MVILFFSHLLHRGKLQAELAAGGFDASGEGGLQPPVHIRRFARHSWQWGWVFLFQPTSVLRVMGTKAVSGPVSGRLLYPSASVMVPLCYLKSPTAHTHEAAWHPISSPSLLGAPRPLPASPHLLLAIFLAPRKPLSPSLFPPCLPEPHLNSPQPSYPLVSLCGCTSISPLA